MTPSSEPTAVGHAHGLTATELTPKSRQCSKPPHTKPRLRSGREARATGGMSLLVTAPVALEDCLGASEGRLVGADAVV